jgi:integrase/recombinase XerC
MVEYLQHVRVEKRLADRTQALYTQHLQDLAQRCAAAQVPPQEVQESHIRQWVAQMRSRGLHARTIALVLSSWRGFYTWLGRQGHIQQHPVLGVRPPKSSKPLPKALSVEEALRLAEQAQAGAEPQQTLHPWQALQQHCMVELLYGAGLRISELLMLDAQPTPHSQAWIDLQAAEAHVLGKGGKRRTVPLGGPAVQAVGQWQLARADWLAQHPKADPAPLFVGTRGQRLTPQVARAQLQAVARQAGINAHVHPHMLRHSFASHVLQSSADLRGVQELMGHADIRTTQVYTRLDFQHLAQAYEAAHPRAKKTPKP